ncbi:[protein-PII] uridylyltransferase [Qingshengfaniella alkalisoli]|uniref:Bifunctional uridylyltransferase/uridylyl-removing enzyme n=1 Tax=Qingshengfaniella alkalisoli TaxID=2599296 RepID=A0A5B8IX49_9RHOB|nr:[protein-PII] uridylyltransferase [Qingshengfaniella alkalisoli]QDY70294.1 [protein-PII] uridylyltransferase [Qingshengfaniella alkalisoli]
METEEPALDLICPASEIFDAGAVKASIDALVDNGETARDLRSGVVDILLKARSAGNAAIAGAIARNPLRSGPAVRSYAYLTDRIVHTAFDTATTHLHPLRSASEGEKIALLAIGGYGRAEMAPFSDVDLLFLTPYKITAWAESVIESMLYILWDLRLKVGHASRTVADCLRLGREDYTIRTSLLENRFLCGHAPLAEELNDRLRKDLFANTASDFIEAKLEERSQRHHKQGAYRYMTEPNVKEGKGGLRDLQSLFWIAKYVHGVDSAAELAELGVFTREEYGQFQRAETFLWAVRNQLHLINRRAMDQLAFDMQVEVAERLGYTDDTERRAVERFMHDYFRHATRVGDLTRIFLASLEANHVKKAPSLMGFFKRKKRLRKGFSLIENRIICDDPEEFLADKLNLLRIFDEALRTGYLMHPDLLRLVTSNLGLIDDEMRRDPQANKIFLRMLLDRGNPERALRRMNELGALGAFMPEFQKIVAMMQFNMYHHYTVDEHTIQCISTLADIERGEKIDSLPFSTRIMHETEVNRRILYVAMLLHDIGKGRKEDHSILGAKIARHVAPRLGLDAEECATVEWLVRYHLLMSDMAQKRDIADPRTVRDFAKAVKTQKRLDLLIVLTTCDIIGVGPGTWNNWKAMLLRNLYRLTTDALATGMEDMNREALETDAKSALRKELNDWPKEAIDHEMSRHYGPYWQGLHTETHRVFAELLDGISNDEIRIDIKQDEARDATRVCFAMADHPGIFARLAGALALVGANVVDARTYTSKDGYATAVFWVQDQDGSPYENARMDRLKTMIYKSLRGQIVTGEAMESRDKIKKRERAFRHPTSIAFDNEGSEIFTIIEVDTRDRPGLLFDVARTLAAANIYISSAQIATYGTQAVDTFYVKDMFGLKLHATARQQALEKRLKDAIEQGANRATT